MKDTILLSHGSGGRMTHDLIQNLFLKHFGANPDTDSALISFSSDSLAFTTDSYVVDPIFFPGGDIGKLAVCGTVNDLTVSGSKPLFLSAGFIIEEGLVIKDLEKIVKSMAKEARQAGVRIVTGDTKVVPHGKADKIFINTAGIGALDRTVQHIASGKRIKPGDKILVNGTLGDHAMTILSVREDLPMKANLQSDCASLNSLVQTILDPAIHFMRDLTRGGLATVVNEICSKQTFGVELDEQALPIKESVRGMCELLGFDPLYLANEGKLVLIVDEFKAAALLKKLQRHPLGKKAVIIGEITAAHPGQAVLGTIIGGQHIIDMLAGEQLPRIC